MEKNIIIAEVEGFTGTNEEYNVVKVSTSYKKGTGIIAHFQEGEIEEGETFNSFKFDMFGSWKARILLLPMTRLNRKKQAEAEKEFFIKSDQELMDLFVLHKFN